MNPLDGKDNKIAGFIFKAQVLQENINKQLTPPMQSSELSLESISKNSEPYLLMQQIRTY